VFDAGTGRVRIALLEDDDDQAELIQLWLKEAGHVCSRFALSQAFLKDQQHNSYDLLILDWELPDMDGLQVLKRLRATLDWPVPVLFVTQRDQKQDIVAALESGADDYMAKPIHKKEMLARVNAVVRRTKEDYDDGGQKLCFEPYELDLNRRVVTIRGEEVKLRNKEYELVVFLFRNIGHVVSRNHLLESVWGTSPDINTRTIDTHMSRIRGKLSLNPENGWRLTSIYQHGYRLEQLGEPG
jgi:two-component system response regulator RegX3